MMQFAECMASEKELQSKIKKSNKRFERQIKHLKTGGWSGFLAKEYTMFTNKVVQTFGNHI